MTHTPRGRPPSAGESLEGAKAGSGRKKLASQSSHGGNGRRADSGARPPDTGRDGHRPGDLPQPRPAATTPAGGSCTAREVSARR